MPRSIKTARRRRRVDPGRKNRQLDRTATPAAAVPTRGEVKAIKKLFDQIPEPELRAALEASDDDRCQKLLMLLDDESYRKMWKASPAVIIRAAGLSVRETLAAIVALYHGDAGLRVARRIPDIMERMAYESEPHYIPCPKCSGSGYDSDDIAEAMFDAMTGKPKKKADRCPRCRGKRRILVPADNDVRKMVLENQDLLGTKAPLIDARSVHIHGGPDMTDWSRSSDDSLERVPKRISSTIDNKETTDDTSS